MDNLKFDRVKYPCLLQNSVVSIDIEFKNLNYVVSQAKGKRHILKGVSGYFKSGELTAIMGPSGAGKSSLLNILTGFRSAEGTIKCTGPMLKGVGAKQHKKHSCYILQDDCLDPLFTVEETMKYAADLKLSTKVSKKSKEILIEEILDSLGLLPCRNTRCQMISGGQKKRLSVALELIGNPSVMFLDEPTTGLDSLSASQIITMLKMLANQGRNIICTIHQPSASLFENFDFVYVMSEGTCIYQGSSRNVVSYLASSELNCPQYHNPADFLIEVANGDYGNHTSVLEVKGIEDKWRNTQTKSSETCNNNEISRNGFIIEDTHNLNEAPSELLKLFIIMKRTFLKMGRDWTISFLKLLLHFIVGIILGMIYFQAGNDASKMIKNIGYLMISIVYLCYTSLMPAVLKFPSELNILKKEQYNNWYKLRTYYVASLLVDIPMQIFFVLSYVSASYVLSAQPLDLYRLSGVILVLLLVSLVASSTGIFFGTLVNPVNGTFIGAITLALMLTVAGFLLLFTHMSEAMYFLSYISYLSYAMEGLTQAVYGYNRLVPCPENVEFCLFSTPADLLREIGMDKPNFWKDVAFLFSSFVTFRLLAFCTLKKNLSKV